ncbi:unannotated protein [freshwater metagenome]|uniref:Unannotated protein n=1 Tax=freshwater metagenome TaxID=449393 RepID=A0A6J6FXF9_9ZZZZ
MFLELRRKLARTHDRSSNEVSKEREIDPEVKKIQGLAPLTSSNIDHITDRLEGEERNSDRQNNVEKWSIDRDSNRSHLFGDCRKEEVDVFEIAENAEIDDDGNPHDPSTRVSALPFWSERAEYRPSEKPVDTNAQEEQQQIVPVPPSIEDKTRGEDEPAPCDLVGSKQPTHGEDHQEEDREIDGGEKHGEVSQMAR